MLDAAGAPSSSRSAAPDGDPRRPRDAPRRAGHHGPRGRLPRDAQPRLRHERRRRRHARQGRAGRRGHPGLRHRARGGRRDAARTRRWSSCRRASPPTRSTRRSTRASRPSSASPRASRPTTCCGVYTYVRPRGVTLLGPNCPGALSPGMANVGIIPAQVFAQGPRRARLALGHADVPDRRRAGPARDRQLDDRRHRRRPGRRLVVHRRPRALRGRPGDRARRHGRRDRRRRGGEGGRVHRRAHDASRSSPTSPASPPRPARRWATPARSSPARAAPRRRRRKRSRRTASASARTRPRSRSSPPKPSAPEPPSRS